MEIEIDIIDTMRKALSQSDNQPIPMETLEEIHDSPDVDLRSMINNNSRQRSYTKRKRGDESELPARRIRATLRWNEDALAKYKDNVYENDSDVT